MNIKRYDKKYIRIRILQNNEVNNMENANRYCSIEDSLKASLQQMQLIKSGSIPKKSWKDFCLEIEKEED